jgi:signal transduction histidine kinase
VHGDFAMISPRRQRGLYRVAQEALTNVVKHSGAQNAQVRLAVDSDCARLSVRDDGRGFDPAAALARERDREHFGLEGMQDRVAALGGTCAFDSHPGSGTAVIVSIPLVAPATESE